MQLISDIGNNINGKLPWDQWSEQERKVFTLCFYPAETMIKSSIDEIDVEVSAKNRLIRHLFNKLDTSAPPKFVSCEFKKISDYDLKIYRESANEARAKLIKIAYKRPPHYPPIK